MNAFLAQFGGNIGNNSEVAIASGLRNSLGMQTVTLKGVPDNTHFGQVLVEADYRMKLIGLDWKVLWYPYQLGPTRQSSVEAKWITTLVFRGGLLQGESQSREYRA